MALNFQSGGNHGMFLVPDIVVDRYITEASQVSMMVLLYILRHTTSFTEEDICSALNINVADLEAAVNFWVQCGILRSEEGNISFEQTSISVDHGLVSAPVKTTAPEYDFSEVAAVVESNKQLSTLFEAVQIRLNKQLSPTNYKILYSFYDFYGFSPEVIFLLVNHCCDIGKGNIKYIEQVAYGWYKSGITTEDAVNKYLEEYEQRRTEEYMVRKVFGIGERSLTTNEEKYIHAWTESYGFGEDIIKLAFEKAVDNTGRVRFTYINKILKSWFEKGYKTAEEAANEPAPESKPHKGKKKVEKEGESTYDLNEFMNWSFNEIYTKDKA
ncbi:MAG: DnaD domain protein [Bacillota bacterium]|nr:DnaD domain protein [Bacillota bacterium]